MKVSHLIEMLERYYTADDYLIVAFWDKRWAEFELDGSLSQKDWEYIAGKADINDDRLAEAVADEIRHHAEMLGA